MIIEPAKRLSNIKEYYFSTKLAQLRKLQDEGNDIINLGIGNPDLQPSISTTKAVNTALSTNNNLHGYQPYRGTKELVVAMQTWYKRIYKIDGIQNFQFVPLMGSKEGIMHITMAFLNEGDGVLIPSLGYPTYSSVSKLVSANIVNYSLCEENGWYPNLGELENLVKNNNCKIIWINYPHMPTGAKAKLSLFSDLVNFAKKWSLLIVHDNPYSLILNKNPLSIFCVEGAEDVALELNSLSKSHNMAGWRVGMLVGRADYVDAVMKVKTNFDSGMFKAVQLGAIAALSNDEQWHKLQNDTYTKRRDIAFKILELLKCTFNKDISGMFVWAKIPDNLKSGEVLSDLILSKSDVFITPGFIFGSAGYKYLRISLCVSEQRLTEAMLRIKQHFK